MTDAPRKIFVVGCGRSGTHLIGQILARDANAHLRMESKPTFSWITQMAVDPSREARLFRPLIWTCKAIHACVYPRDLVEKSHPALWLAEKLADALPDARFVAVRRQLLATVASMMQHKGTRKWVTKTWRSLPTPNRFLGITDVKAYGEMSLEERCALRVIAHSKEIDRLSTLMPDRIRVVEYERIDHPLLRGGTTDKWRQDLTVDQLERVRNLAWSLDATRFLED